MKTYSLILLFFCFGVCKGQVTYIDQTNDLSGNGYIRKAIAKYDTVKVLCQVSDTAEKFYTLNNYHKIIQPKGGMFGYAQDTTRYHTNGIFWIYLYSVREKHNTAEGVLDPYSCMGCNWHDYWQHLYYLDEKLNPLPKNIVVWQSIEIK